MIKLQKLSQYAILPLILLSLLLATPVSTAYAIIDNFQITRVRGQAIDGDGHKIVLADVSATCDGQTKTAKTNGQGKFLVVFFGKDICEAGSIVTITITKNGLTGTGSGPVQITRDGRIVDRNIFLSGPITVAAVPEFGATTGAIAAIASIGVFYMMRRRKLAPKTA